MTFEFRRNGRKVSSKKFFEGISEDVTEIGMEHIEEKYHGIASSIIDPETGRPADIIVRRVGKSSVRLIANGSPAFARELERRIGLNEGTVELPKSDAPNVYLAHASENKANLAEPLARTLFDAGIYVWLDKWEIRSGDSLRQKMEQGLSNCSHFVVLLTPESINKPWVNAEIDAGFLQDIEGSSAFIALRNGISVGDLSPFLKSRLCPEIDLNNSVLVDSLVDDIFGRSKRPDLGSAPSYVQTVEPGLATWSNEAQALAKHLVLISKTGSEFDPETNIEACAIALDMPMDLVRFAVVDLEEGGLIERAAWNDALFHVRPSLFVEFDRHFLDFDNREDAKRVAGLVVQEGGDYVESHTVCASVADWSVRRFNSALNTLVDLRLVSPERVLIDHTGSEFAFESMRVTDKTRRYVHRNKTE